MRLFAVSYYIIAKYNSASSGAEIGERHSFVKIDKICRPIAYISVLVRSSFEESALCVTWRFIVTPVVIKVVLLFIIALTVWVKCVRIGWYE